MRALRSTDSRSIPTCGRHVGSSSTTATTGGGAERRYRAHSLDPDTAEYAAEAIALISFLYKVAEAAKT
jgi:hypothetical protein